MTPAGPSSRSSADATRYTPQVWSAWAAVVFCAFALRVVQMGESLWLDELHTAWTVADGWSAIVWRAEMGNQTPLYFWIVGLCQRVVGFHEIGLRLPSLLAGLALVLFAGWLAQRWTGSVAAGLLVGLLLAWDRHAVFYAQEARPYALVQLVGLVHVGLFLALLRRPTWRLRGAWIASGWGVYYLHYTAILVVPAQLLAWCLLHVRPAWRPRYRARQLLIDGGILALGLVPSLPQVLEIGRRRSAWELFIPRDVPFGTLFSLFPLRIYLLIPLGLCVFAGSCWVVRRVLRGRGGAACDAGPGGELGRSCAAIGGRFGDRLAILLVVACWLWVPLLVAWCATVQDWARLFFLRYVVVSAAAAPLAAGLIWSLLPSRRWRLVCAGSLIVALIWQGGMIPNYVRERRVIGDRRQDWRGAVQRLQQQVPDSDGPVLVRSGLIEANRLRQITTPRLRDYCLLPVQGLYRLDVPPDRLHPLSTSGSCQLTEQQEEQLLAAGEAWFLLAGNARTVQRIQAAVTGELLRRGRQVHGERESFGHVTVLHLRAISKDDSTDAPGLSATR